MFNADAYIASLPNAISKSEFRLRQDRLLSQLEDDDILIITARKPSTRSNDVEYPFRNNSDMLYFCGWTEPQSILFAHKKEGVWSVELFVQPRNILMEIWHGRRPGIEGAVNNWPIDDAHSIEDFEGILGSVLAQSSKVYIRGGLDSTVDMMVKGAIEARDRPRQQLGDGPTAIHDPSMMIAELRLRKSEAEIELMRHACKVSSGAHIEAMRNSSEGIGEWQLQAIIEGYFQWNGQSWAYPSIVGFAENATILHYHQNDCRCEGEGIVLIDAGSEFKGYAADITRSWPTSGRFTEEQRDIYELVLSAQKAAIEQCRVGNPFNAPHEAARNVLAEGLISLGISEQSLEDSLTKDGDLGKWYMHNTGHWIGLDVHDVGIYRPNGEPRLFEEGMVITVEPGLYFGAWRDDVDVPPRYADIGIRIEDDVLITANDPDVLSKDCPKEIDELEAIIGSNYY